MTDLLQKIIEVDKAARARVKEAEKARTDAYAGVEAKKTELIREEKQKAMKKTEKLSEEHKKTGEKQLSALQQQDKTVEERMRQRYEEKKDEWVRQITEAVLSGQEG